MTNSEYLLNGSEPCATPHPPSKLGLPSPQGEGYLGLYIHIPFCVKKCNYCNFYSVVPKGDIKQRYIKSLCKEIKKWGECTARPIDTLYIGGGTPSLLSDVELTAIFSAVRDSFNLTSDAEITVEVNPGDNLGEFLKCAARLGVNRVSVGVQSFCENELCTLGRRHSAADAKTAVDAARNAGINNISADIMIGLPNSTGETLDKSIDGILSLGTEHISAYILKVEKGTPFDLMKINLPNDEETSDQYLQLCDRLKEAGFEHYEISNFAKKGYESRHNNRYWLLQEYIGIGPAAHSFYEGERFYYPSDIEDFIENGNTVSDGKGGDRFEYIMLSLRLAYGLRFKEYEKRFGEPYSPFLLRKAKNYEKFGLCRVDDESISLTDKGMLVSNPLIHVLTGEMYEDL